MQKLHKLFKTSLSGKFVILGVMLMGLYLIAGGTAKVSAIPCCDLCFIPYGNQQVYCAEYYPTSYESCMWQAQFEYDTCSASCEVNGIFGCPN